MTESNRFGVEFSRIKQVTTMEKRLAEEGVYLQTVQ